ncbi:MAG: TonB-dependent receptor [Alistipes sp.]|nr:TonB-dependent receptor [Alistipes sp.]
MKRRLYLLVWAILLFQAAIAQTVDEPFTYPYAEEEEERTLPQSDYTLFERAIASTDDLYRSITAFRLPQVSIKRRGEAFDREHTTLLGLPIDYRQGALLRQMGLSEVWSEGIDFGAESVGSTGGGRHFRWQEGVPLEPLRVAARYADRDYRFGAEVAYHVARLNGWQMAAVGDLRTGRDARIEGVFTNRVQTGFSLQRHFPGGDRLLLVATLPYSMRGLRSPSTEEAFLLTNNPYYNPSWGLQGGRVRNARVRREFLPQLSGAWQHSFSDQLSLQVAGGGRYTLRKQSGLGWYDARTPLPDNYRKMPSYTGDVANDAAWRRADPRYTQVDWDELIAQNRLSAGSARYAVEDRCSADWQGALRVAVSLHRDGFELDGGWRAEYSHSRRYQEMRDLLGASYLLDVDHYLIDDDSYANQLENNLRAPSRHVREGDRFGYDYALIEQTNGLWLHALHAGNRLRVELMGELLHAERYRHGYYEKELFPGAGSYGESRHLEHNPYTLKALVGWSLSPRHHLQLTLAAGGELPQTEALFVQPRYNNRTISRPELMRYEAAQLRLRGTTLQLHWQLTAFATLRYGAIESYTAYDDLSGAYCDLLVEDLSTSAIGLEGAAQWRVARRWSIDAAASVGRYRYLQDPLVTLLRDTDNTPVEERAKSHAAECRVGGAPSLTATLGVSYYGPKGWSGRLSLGGVADRYVDPAWTRRTERVARQNGTSPEAVASFMQQERLEDVVTLDCTIHKSIYFAHSTLQLTLSARNLTAAEYRTYGYESMRTQRQGSSVASMRLPQANRYLYAAPRSLLLTVGYRF